MTLSSLQGAMTVTHQIHRHQNNWLRSIFSLQHKISILALLSILLFLNCTAKYVKNTNNKNNFDYFIFSQRWLPSACIAYEEHNKSNHCKLPQNYTFWAIHGLWPTGNHTFGPFFCNTSLPFDSKALEPIRPSLQVFWPNIEQHEGATSLWRHEWNKHGTCSAALESLNTELKYFNASLNLYKQYNMNALTSKFNIKPDNRVGLNVMDIFNTLKESLGKTPHINCITEVKTDRAYLSELRLCFNKALELIDCEEINLGKLKYKKTITNCPLDQKVMFPDAINISLTKIDYLQTKLDNIRNYGMLVDILQVIKFLQWASL